MPLTPPRKENVEAAVRFFDEQLRESAPWQDWQNKQAFLFGVRCEGRVYPPQPLLSHSLGIDIGDLPGGLQQVELLEAAGFTAEALRYPPRAKVAPALHDLLLQHDDLGMVPADAAQALGKRFRLGEAMVMKSTRSGDGLIWQGIVEWAGSILQSASRIFVSGSGNWVISRREHPVVWLEKTNLVGRPDRVDGPYALGQALWSPVRGKGDRDTYSSMRDVQAGDYVLHLIDGSTVIGASRAIKHASSDFIGLENTAWAGNGAYIIPLENYRELAPALHRDAFLREPAFKEQLLAIRARHSNLFYNRNLTLLEGFYLTQVPVELVEVLDSASRRSGGNGLPLISAGTIMDLPMNVAATEAQEASQAPSDEPLPSCHTVRRVWLYAPGRGAERWEEFYEEGTAAIGWDHVGDLTGRSLEEFLHDLREPNSDINPTNDARACYDFAQTMHPGDRIFVKRGRRQIVGYGKVTSGYRYEPERVSYRSVRSVRWAERGVWETDRDLPMKTLTDITGNEGLVAYLEILVQLRVTGEEVEDDGTHEAMPTLEPYSVADALEDLFLSEEDFRTMLRIWTSRRNLIIQGPPGVGKTFLAKRLAYALMGVRDASRLGMVQFHQSYAYEDFVQGFRPTAKGLALQDGLFLEFCDRAAKDPERPHVFVIDEINRGNVSKILGELMMLIEADKRGSAWAIPLVYADSSERRFYVPENVHLLGLMNTADRSLSFVDHALRRRFAFWMARPEIGSATFAGMLKRKGIPAELISDLVAFLHKLNGAITRDTTSLGAGYAVGHSYFCRDRVEDESPRQWLADIAETELIPLLNEYWIDEPDTALRWTSEFRQLTR